MVQAMNLRNIPRPGASLFSASWPVGGPGLSLAISQDLPVVSGPATTWKTFDRPGGQGQGLVDPQPNQFLQSTGSALFWNIPAPGAPLLTAAVFDNTQPLSVEAILAGGEAPGGYAGPVISNGEGNYLACYLLNISPTTTQLAVFTPAFSTAILPWNFPVWVPQALRVDVVEGKGLVLVNSELVYVCDLPTCLPLRPAHAGLYLCGKGNVGRFDVWGG